MISTLHPKIGTKITEIKSKVKSWLMSKVSTYVLGSGAVLLHQFVNELRDKPQHCKEATLCGKILCIPYVYRGKEYTCYTHYYRRWSHSTEIIGVQDGSTTNINHHPCTPFTVTCKDLGYDSVQVRDSHHDVIHTYTGDEKIHLQTTPHVRSVPLAE